MTAYGLRRTFCHGDIPYYIDKKRLQRLVFSILDLAGFGLEKRGFNEMRFLKPLYDRALQKTNPALAYLIDLSEGTALNELVCRYAKIV